MHYFSNLHGQFFTTNVSVLVQRHETIILWSEIISGIVNHEDMLNFNFSVICYYFCKVWFSNSLFDWLMSSDTQLKHCICLAQSNSRCKKRKICQKHEFQRNHFLRISKSYKEKIKQICKIAISELFTLTFVHHMT